MESRTTSAAPLTTALLAAPLALPFALAVTGCGKADQPSAGQAAAGTARLEYWDPDTKQLIKSRGTDLYGQFIGEREWYHRNQTLAKKGQYDDQGREIGEWMEYHQIGTPAARYSYAEGAPKRVGRGSRGKTPPAKKQSCSSFLFVYAWRIGSRN